MGNQVSYEKTKKKKNVLFTFDKNVLLGGSVAFDVQASNQRRFKAP